MNYLDFHTHKRNYDDVICINSPLNFEDYLPQKEFFNIGLHPWRYSNFESLFKSFQNTILKHKENKLFLGAGEVGLDRTREEVHLSKQIEYFERVLNFLKAQEVTMLTIHSVKTHHEVMKLLQNINRGNKTFNICIHDFNGTYEEMMSLSSKVDCFFSIGPTYYKNNAKIQKVLKEIPLDRMFLESDEANYCIKDHYQEVSNQLGLEKKELAMQCMTNFEIFKNL